MKKKILLLMFLVFTITIGFAQKFDLQNYKKELAQKMLKPSHQIGARATYLMDSVKISYFEFGDSSLAVSIKMNYLSDGRLNNQSFFVNFMGFAEFYFKEDYFYDKLNPNLITAIAHYESENGYVYNKSLVDSFFYDNKNRTVLTRSRNAAQEIRKYEISIYKTGYSTPDTIKTYTYDHTLMELVQSGQTANIFDAQGKLTDQFTNEHSTTGGFAPRNRIFNQYNVQNLKSFVAIDFWNDTNLSWDKEGQIKNYYNAKNDIQKIVTEKEWSDYKKNWTSKDSVYIVYNKAGNESSYFTYLYSYASGLYTMKERTATKYDVNDNLAREEIFDVNLYNYSYVYQYWWSALKNSVATEDIFSKDFNLKIANPIGENADLTLVSERNGTYQLVAFDMNGRMISHQKINNNETIQTNLPSAGQYLYIVTDANNKPLTMKKVVKQ